MKFIYSIVLFLIATASFSQEIDWIKTEGTIIEISINRGRKVREVATIKFKLEDGAEQLGAVELFRVPFIGSMKSVGDNITISYDKNDPLILRTVIGNFLSKYGIYILVFLGVIFSIKPLLKNRKKI